MNFSIRFNKKKKQQYFTCFLNEFFKSSQGTSTYFRAFDDCVMHCKVHHVILKLPVDNLNGKDHIHLHPGFNLQEKSPLNRW